MRSIKKKKDTRTIEEVKKEPVEKKIAPEDLRSELFGEEEKPPHPTIHHITKKTTDNKTIPVQHHDSSKITEDKVTMETKEEEEEVPVAEVKIQEKSSIFFQTIFPVIIGVLVGAITAVSIIVVYNSNLLKASKVETKSVEPTPTVVVSPVPEENSTTDFLKEDLTLYDIEVLNGSGKGGEAGKLEKVLKDKGYSVLEIGNADKSTYKKTVVQFKTKVSETYTKKLIGDLEQLFEVEIGDELLDNSKTDVVIIVGSLVVPSVTLSVTPTP